MTRLVTSRLTLRGPVAADLDDLFAIYGDRDAMRYWSTEPHADKSVTRGMLARMQAAFDTDPTYFVWDHDGRVIGAGGRHRGDEVGFILHPDYWRKGFGREAMQAIIPYLWDSTSLPRLTADADPRNAASVGLLTALGFRETGRAKNTFCIAGEWSDSVYLALERPR